MFLKSMIPAIFISISILILSIMPGKDLPYFTFWDIIGIDKIGHLFAYYSLSVLLLYGFLMGYAPGVLKENSHLFGFIFSCSYGIIMEIIQGLFFTDRNADWVDIIFNSSGAFIGILTYKSLIKTALYRGVDSFFKKFFIKHNFS